MLYTRVLAPLVCLTAMSAANYSVQRTTSDGLEIVILRDEARRAEVRVVPSLGNNAYEFLVNGKRVFWSPYQSLREFSVKPVNLGNPFLWPWANRIDGLSYTANGRKYTFNLDIDNVRPGQRQTPIHGLLVFEKRWQVTRTEGGESHALVTSRFEFSKYPELMVQFPFAHSIEMTYRLREGMLEVETLIENKSVEPLPVSLGYHPYFLVHDAPRDQWTVTLPAKTRYTLSERLIPTGETAPSPYQSPVSLQGVVLDDVFGDLVRDPDGFARFMVQGKQEKVIVEYGPNYHVAVVYAPAGRGFICFEPMTSITNAFNAHAAGWYKDLQSILPGGTWREVFRVRTEGF